MQYNVHRKSKKVKYIDNKVAWMSQSQGIEQTSVDFPVFMFIYCSIYATAHLEIKNADFKNSSKKSKPI